MATGYEIRHRLLNEARGMLFDKWHRDYEVLCRNANITNQPIDHLPQAPTATEIKKLAEDLYEFVQRK